MFSLLAWTAKGWAPQMLRMKAPHLPEPRQEASHFVQWIFQLITLAVAAFAGNGPNSTAISCTKGCAVGS